MTKRLFGAPMMAVLLTLVGLTADPARAQHPVDLPLQLRPDCTPFVFGPIVMQEEPTPTPATTPYDHLTTSVIKVVNYVLQSATGSTSSNIEITPATGEEQEPTPAMPEIIKEMPLEAPQTEWTPVVPEIIKEMPLEAPQTDDLRGGCLTLDRDGWLESCRESSEEPPTATTLSEDGWIDIFEKADAENQTECSERYEDARRLFWVGERCRLEGHFDMANNCYQEVDRLCPDTFMAQIARARIQKLNAVADSTPATDNEDTEATEEQEPSKDAVEDMVRQLNEGVEELMEQLKAVQPAGQHDGPCYDQEASRGSPCCPFAHLMPSAAMIRELRQQKLKDAHSLYLIGERCRRNGDPNMARQFYQEAREVCPGSRFAHKANQRLGQLVMRQRTQEENASEEQDMPPVTAPKVEHQSRQSKAKKMFQMAERFESMGDLSGAYSYYQQVHMLCPESIYGRQAIARMAQLEQQRASETPQEQEQPQDEDVSFLPLQITCPLLFGSDTKTDSAAKGSEVATTWVERYLQAVQQVVQDTFGETNVRVGGIDIIRILPETHVEWEMIEALDRVLQEITEITPKITITPVESSTPEVGSEEEQEPVSPPQMSDLATPLVIPATIRNLRVVEEGDDENSGEETSACLDLSDWLRQVVAMRPSGVHLKIKVNRLGRLLAEGEHALRCLGCELVADSEGRSYVVYPSSEGRR